MDRWSQLSLKDKSDLMSLYIRNGISSLEEIKKHYNSYDNGGNVNKDITEVLNDIPSWKQGLVTEQHIPYILATREQYIQNQRNIARQNAYQKSLERTEPEHYKVFRKIKDEEIPLYKELINAAEIKLNNPTVADKEKQQVKSDITTLKDILRRGSVYEDEENCIYTALTNYGEQYRVPGNQSFRSNPTKYGFEEIDLGDVKQGDIIQYLGRGVPKHGAIYSKSEDGKILANYSNGTTEYRKNAYYGSDPKYAYRFIGLPEDLSRWNQEYDNLLNNFATGGHLYRDGGPDEPNFVGGATALKKDYNYELEHLADKYAVTESGPWHDYGIHNPSPSQKAHWNELSRMYNRVAQRPNYQRLNPINIVEYTPIVGDAVDVGHSLYDLQQGNIGLGLAGLGILALPNIIEKPLGKITRRVAPIVDKNAVSTYWDRFSNRVRQKYGDDILDKIDFIQSNTPEDKRIASNILERKAEAMSKEYNIGTKEDWLKTIAQKVKTPGFSLPETSIISTKPVVYTTNNPYIYSREAANKRFGEAVNKFGYDITQHNLVKPHETAHILPEASESLTDNIFNLADLPNYFIKNNFDEVKARGTQLKDYFNSDRLTGDMLKYAAKNYSKDTGIKNNMKYMFNRIKDWDKMAEWMTKYSPAIALPIVATASQED